jgi:hypothetical protein
MNNGKKHQKKRKRLSSPIKSQIAKRLEKLRVRTKDLWGDDDDDDNQETSKQSKPIVLSSSEEEEERPSVRRKLRKKTPKNPTCLICSILSQLSSCNCCSEHLSLLKNHSHHSKSKCLSERVMIVPLTNEIVQRYLDPQQIHQLRKHTDEKSTMTLDLSESQESIFKSPAKSPQNEMPPLASTIVIESVRSNSATIPPDITTTTTTTVINNSEKIITIDEDQIIIIDDTPSSEPRHDPWIPISDEIDAALEKAIDQIDSVSDSPLEFTPATARRTETEVMAARLPKIPLKPGRFRHGKPIIDRSTTNAANEYRPLAATQPSSNIPSPPTSNIEPTNDQILTQDELPITTRTNENPGASSSTTPSRISFRLNPDGTRVSISRPPLPTNPQSPLLSSLRRTSTDVTPISKEM